MFNFFPWGVVAGSYFFSALSDCAKFRFGWFEGGDIFFEYQKFLIFLARDSNKSARTFDFS